MPNALAAHITEAHRLAQARLGAQTVQQFLPTWQLLDVEDLDAGVETWLRIATPIVRAAKTTSARLTASYYSTFRTLETGPGKFTPAVLDTVNTDQLAVSLLATGPYRLKAAVGRGMAVAKALDIARASSSGAAMRLSLEGGRDTFVHAVANDKRAAGYERVTSGNACDFCTLLAGRGAVYSENTIDFEAHDHCSCAGQPVFH